MTKTSVTTQVYSVYIKRTPQAVWDAITQPDWSEKYMYQNRVEYDLRPGGAYRGLPGAEFIRVSKENGYEPPEVCVDGEVIEVDPPNRLVQTWRMVMDEGMKAEGFTRLTWELQEIQPGLTKLTVVHDLEGAPTLAVMVAGGREHEGAGGGWNEVLSGLKTVLETGETLKG